MRLLPLILPLVAVFGSPALADVASAPDVVVYADPTMAATMDHLGSAFRRTTGVPVRVFPMPTPLAVALVRQGARNDVLAIEANAAEIAHGRNLAGPTVVAVHDPVVLASADGVSTTLADAVKATGKVATVDPVSADRLDGPALAASISISAGRIAGQPDGPDAVKQIALGTATLALVERADTRTPGVQEVAVVPATLRAYVIAGSHNAISPESARFLAYVRGPDAAPIFAAAGWEVGP